MKSFFRNRILSMALLCIIIVGLMLTIIILATPNDDDDGKLTVYTSNYVLWDFTNKIGGKFVNVTCLTNPGEEAHGYEPSALQMAKLEESDLIIINGLGFEEWLTNLGTSITNKIIDTSQNIVALYDCDEQSHDGHTHDEYDPHVWLSIQNAIIQLENITTSLINIDQQNKQYYEDNFNKYSLLLNLLHQEYLNTFSSLINNTIIVTHQAFAYLCDAYNLTQYSLSGINDEDEPTSLTMAQAITYVEQTSAKVIFYQTDNNTKVAQSLANYTGTKILKLHTLESYTQNDIESGEDYLSLMAQNLINLKEALL